MTIKNKLFFSFGFAFLLVLGISGYVLKQFDLVNAQLNTVVNRGAEKIKLAGRINTGIVEVARAEKNLILATQQAEMLEYAANADRHVEEIRARLTALRRLATPEELARLDDFSSIWAQYISVNQEIRRLTLENSNVRAKLLSQGDGRVYFEQAQGILQRIQRRNLQSVLDPETDTSQRIENRLRLADEMQRALFELQRSEKNIILATDRLQMEEYQSVGQRIVEELESRMERLSDIASAGGQNDVATLRRLLDNYLRLHRQVRDLTLSNSNVRAFELSGDKGRALRREASALLTEIVNDIDARFEGDKQASDESLEGSLTVTSTALAIGFIALLIVSAWVVRTITRSVSHLTTTAEAIGRGELDVDVVVESTDELGQLSHSISAMRQGLKSAAEANERALWQNQMELSLSSTLSGRPALETLTLRAIGEVCRALDAKVGTCYLINANATGSSLQFSAGYGYSSQFEPPEEFALGEGLLGEAARSETIIAVDDLPADYMHVRSSLGEREPSSLAIFACRFADETKAICEIGLLKPLEEHEKEFLEAASRIIGVGIEAAQSTDRLNEALAESQRLTEEAMSQQNEMSALNEELEEQNSLLEKEKRNVERAQRDLMQKADELAEAGRYKSEFLANMSHELRSPLNSLLLLSRSLYENRSGNLLDDQVQSAQLIYQSGNDLLELINDILDLSKIEAGHLSLQKDQLPLEELADSVDTAYQHVAAERGIALNVNVALSAPATLESDRTRVRQILRNLLSNAIKFTEEGSVSVTFEAASAISSDPKYGLAVSVKDTGIGIKEADQKRIFETFQQADGSTSRRFGGTGLGLSISRDLAHLLGGQITVASVPGEGSVFTLLLPLVAPFESDKGSISTPPSPETMRRNTSQAQAKPKQQEDASKDIPVFDDDDRDKLADGERWILIVEDDIKFIPVLMSHVHDHNFKCIATTTAEEALTFIERHPPEGILLDMLLPTMSGFDFLSQLKHTPNLRHIPVHVVSALEPNMKPLEQGAIGFFQKPVSTDEIESAITRLIEFANKKSGRILVVEDDDAARRGMLELLTNSALDIDGVATGAEAIDAIRDNHYDCMILDLGLPDMDGRELLEKLSGMSDVAQPPVIVYTGRELTREEEMTLREYADAIVIKSVRSEERLLDEVSLFLHRVLSDLPEDDQSAITELYSGDRLLEGKKVMIVDDDVRTLFALSGVLSERGMEIVKADNGKKALEVLVENPDVELILMDVMMPEMDGYETTAQIREMPGFQSLPIISLTAKAMPDDRRKCLEAGANDYMAKPVDVDRLLSLLRIWLYR